MIQVTEQLDRCFAQLNGKCLILIRKQCAGCRFYKPAGCEDWVRAERNGKVLLIPPEEYGYESNNT